MGLGQISKNKQLGSLNVLRDFGSVLAFRDPMVPVPLLVFDRGSWGSSSVSQLLQNPIVLIIRIKK